MIKPHRHHPLWYAFLLHRISGIALAVFLPAHFYILALVLEGNARLDSFLHWSEQPWVKFAEFGLVFLLAAHLLGGVRLMAVELLPWSSRQKNMVSITLAMAFLIAGCYLLRAL